MKLDKILAKVAKAERLKLQIQQARRRGKHLLAEYIEKRDLASLTKALRRLRRLRAIGLCKKHGHGYEAAVA